MFEALTPQEQQKLAPGPTASQRVRLAYERLRMGKRAASSPAIGALVEHARVFCLGEHKRGRLTVDSDYGANGNLPEPPRRLNPSATGISYTQNGGTTVITAYNGRPKTTQDQHFPLMVWNELGKRGDQWTHRTVTVEVNVDHTKARVKTEIPPYGQTKAVVDYHPLSAVEATTLNNRLEEQIVHHNNPLQ